MTWARIKALEQGTSVNKVVSEYLELYAGMGTTERALPLPEADAVALVDRLRQLPVVAIDGDLVATAIAHAGGWQLSYWDALIIAAAEAAGCARVPSEDLADGTTYGSVQVVNPFRSSAQPARS